ncbi:HAMP domain-containing sensor histidine kinase [Kitasatospora sp. NPDC093558]|uniref:sensor histidine kinase n=1 Tax=Kitasatospora sp. NPDC093558 TaxID=3155201 RepID=UPI0034423C38
MTAKGKERPGAARWFGRMTLRGRLALFTAAAVSLAVVACAVAGWFVARNEMVNQVDRTLSHAWTPGKRPPSGPQLKSLADLCHGTAGQPWMPKGGSIPTVIVADGTSCPPNDPRAVTVAPEDLPIAGSGSTGPHAASLFRDGRTADGTPVRVYVVSIGPVGYGGSGGTGPTAAVAISQPLEPVQDALTELALITAGAAAVVIALAAAGALWIARTALRPVDRLTRAAQHIARTQEPGMTIEVSGHDEIARFGEAFNAMSTALAGSLDSQARLIADAGHELRTPLASMRTNVDLLIRSQETGRPLPAATLTRMLGNMKAQMTELSTLIGDLLELSRPAESRDAKPLPVVALHDIAARAVERAELRGPALAFGADLAPWYVRADPHALERAVINLLDNAVKFSPPGGRIDVSLANGELTVRDQGPGIAAEDLPHVFDRFWRSPSARQLPGSGLGLAIVARTVRATGGEVTLAPAGPDGGTAATVRLPGAATPPPETPPPASQS